MGPRGRRAYLRVHYAFSTVGLLLQQHRSLIITCHFAFNQTVDFQTRVSGWRTRSSQIGAGGRPSMHGLCVKAVSGYSMISF